LQGTYAIVVISHAIVQVHSEHMTNPNNPIATVSSFFSLVEGKQLDAAYALLSDDLVVRGPAPVPLGKKEYTAVHSAWSKACSDWSFNLSKAEVVAGGKVAATIAISATLDGDLVGLPVPGLPARIAPTGRRAKLPEEHPVVTVEGGKITALEFATPPGGGIPGLLAQMGVGK
jgi:ketosteroid isomerase-like protein